ncbi:CHASE2 domain-containing protein [Anabaena sp. UHCC 0451]|uniref:CHASE2 domain-containing protein n=1 Tax=Anabaena sp. UHCC 0451 TaxID=2055235 RepID=UPI002B20364A|nr:CHASE2 domain-containing protein [Anabaena sp. UHCC 0451]MEA5575684.1 CHASE2 domain-containing protein [Anabaena sp. UHCC 0451]
MWKQLGKQVRQVISTEQSNSLVIASATAAVVILTSLTGIFQLLEWVVIDQWFNLRPLEPVDSRIVIVTINEADINSVKQWPIPDQVLAKLIEKLKQHQPRVIGLDIYRNLPVLPGHEQLKQVFLSTPNLIGIEKLVPPAIAPPPQVPQERIGFSDIVLDADGNARRGLLFADLPNQPSKFGFATKVALEYLKQEGIIPQLLDQNSRKIKLGNVIFAPLKANDGGYVGADAGGYQILMNFRGGESRFQTISMIEVLKSQIPAHLFKDRIVLIGTTAESVRDIFETPNGRIHGIIFHANLISQIVNTGLENRPFIQTIPDYLEWVWIWIFSLLGTIVSLQLLQTRVCYQKSSPYCLVIGMILQGGCLLIIHYFIFINGWWLPIVSPLLSQIIVAIANTSYYNQKLRLQACIDDLTQVANRRHFDDCLRNQVSKRGNVSLILCDVDCFKIYNDTYGHQAGDKCLTQVAAAISAAVRTSDVVARYGGEEFAVILPNTNLETAARIAEQIVNQVRSLNISHINSTARPFVTLSCGVNCMKITSDVLASDLILNADRALYMAKNQGRDRFILYTDSIINRQSNE